jgi:HdeA/HdeB family protein
MAGRVYIMRQTGSDRDAAIGFIHGYLLGKAGSTTFNVEALEKQTDAFIDRCLDNPNEKALDAMMKVKG